MSWFSVRRFSIFILASIFLPATAFGFSWFSSGAKVSAKEVADALNNIDLEELKELYNQSSENPFGFLLNNNDAIIRGVYDFLNNKHKDIQIFGASGFSNEKIRIIFLKVNEILGPTDYLDNTAAFGLLAAADNDLVQFALTFSDTYPRSRFQGDFKAELDALAKFTKSISAFLGSINTLQSFIKGLGLYKPNASLDTKGGQAKELLDEALEAIRLVEAHLKKADFVLQRKISVLQAMVLSQAPEEKKIGSIGADKYQRYASAIEANRGYLQTLAERLNAVVVVKVRSTGEVLASFNGKAAGRSIQTRSGGVIGNLFSQPTRTSQPSPLFGSPTRQPVISSLPYTPTQPSATFQQPQLVPGGFIRTQ